MLPTRLFQHARLAKVAFPVVRVAPTIASAKTPFLASSNANQSGLARRSPLSNEMDFCGWATGRNYHTSKLQRTVQTAAEAHATNSSGESMTLSKLIRQYGLVAAVVYALVSAIVFWSIYFGIRFAGVDANWMLERLEPVRKLLGLAHHQDKDAQEAQEAKSIIPDQVKDIIKRCNDAVSPYIDPAVFSVTFVITKILFPLELALVFAITRKWALRWRAKHGHPSLNTLYAEHRHRRRKVKVSRDASQ